MRNVVPQDIDDISEDDVKRIVGWIGRHALPATLPHTMPEYRTGLALDAAVNWTADHLRARYPLLSAQEHRNVVRNDWNMLVKVASVWSDEDDYPGWQTIR
ncbi:MULTISPECIES: hypothetical protein [unclassified Streptomyces]|uniref:hypothetical protein n=1 Tax=unclassified Streptomyces TaxID=2593676 RepID=UPI0008049B68|nr:MULTISPECIES: hypothetical protein [unclassified Streptomyces]MYR75157.1 hypothetical protein [Streptomyces sp. SID4925]SBU98070.1 hypothetical protein YUMDRAFT_06031 [Streptomyces sp. OspMP-M45]